MPNWCHNKLTVTGRPEAVARFVEAVKSDEQPLDFERVCPTPLELVDERGSGGDSWHGWRLDHWGTKWNACFDGPLIAVGAADAEVPHKRTPIIDPGKAFYAFETAWSPPLPIIAVLAGRHQDVEIELVFAEAGEDFAGCVAYKSGKLVSAQRLDVEQVLTPEEMWF